MAKLWKELKKNELNLQGQLQFTSNQTLHSILKLWRDAFIKYTFKHSDKFLK